MHIRKNAMTTTSVLRFSLLVVFYMVVLTACGVSPEKNSGVEQAASSEPVTPQEAQQPASSAGSKVDVKSQTDLGGAPDTVAEQEEVQQSAAQVIEPEITVEPDIKLEPIPEATPESKSTPTMTEADAASKQAAAESEDSVKIAKIEPAITKPSTPETPIPSSSSPDHFVITVGKKDQRHPKFGVGHEMGFLINNVPGGAVVVERGKAYSFDVATNPKHDVYISTKPIGWGASPWSEGVEGAYIYQGTMRFTPPADAPDVLYYSCRNHPYMGGEIHVIDPGEEVDIGKLTSTEGAAVAKSPIEKPSQPQVSVAMVNQKLMFASMLLNSTASTRVKASANEEAKQMQTKAETLVGNAKSQLTAGNNQQALASAEDALALLKSAAGLVPSEEEASLLKESYEELLHSVHNFEQSHEESYKRTLKEVGGKSAVDYDKKQVAELKEQAQSLANKNDYVNANKKLENAQYIITAAIQKMLNSQTIVYDLNFETPQEEYEYELKRFSGYEELIPVAVEQKQPNEGTKKLMESFVQKGQKKRSIAVETAKAGDYARAVAMLQDATKEIRRALRMVGVMQ